MLNLTYNASANFLLHWPQRISSMTFVFDICCESYHWVIAFGRHARGGEAKAKTRRLVLRIAAAFGGVPAPPEVAFSSLCLRHRIAPEQPEKCRHPATLSRWRLRYGASNDKRSSKTGYRDREHQAKKTPARRFPAGVFYSRRNCFENGEKYTLLSQNVSSAKCRKFSNNLFTAILNKPIGNKCRRQAVNGHVFQPAKTCSHISKRTMPRAFAHTELFGHLPK